MSSPVFQHYDLKLIEPSFSSTLTDLIIELDYLRRKQLHGSTHPMIFFQLKQIFHMLESIGSARIEGNNTTIADYFEARLEPEEELSSALREIRNIEETMDFIENIIKDYPINDAFVSVMHTKLVEGLSASKGAEGDKTPGKYRTSIVKISKSSHLPPEGFRVKDYMQELFDFINEENNPKYDLLKAAIAHHRFVWIHPFGNGNGRTVRLLTYAMLIKTGFNVNVGKIINPTAIFCSDRQEYYRMLSKADSGTNEGILEWCEYVLKGLKVEIEKVDKLLDYKFLNKEILLPAIDHSLEREYITETDAKILKKAIQEQVIQASDVKEFYSGKAGSEVSRQIRRLIQKKMLVPEGPGKRKYVISFDNNYLLRGVIKHLGEQGFLPLKD